MGLVVVDEILDLYVETEAIMVDSVDIDSTVLGGNCVVEVD